jgi:putative exosortase-associated protein (TIGR04073 family)
MRLTFAPLMLPAMAALLLVGCAGPEQKLGRGLTNFGEIIRMGEMSRAREQAALFEGSDFANTTGVVRGFNATMKRTLYGAYEVVTFPLPNYKNKDYGPILKPVNPPFPASYRPGLSSDPTFNTDFALGFSSGDIVPFIPGSRFRVFEP